jgi:phthiocerol/phenolphthiocerol synthesis type-I polyketide synthase E
MGKVKQGRIAERLAGLGPEQRKLMERLLTGNNPRDRVEAAGFDDEALQSFHTSAARTKSGTRKFYNAINRQLDATIFGGYSAFLNYGYVADGSPQMSPLELPAQMLNRTSVKLVLELIGNCNLAGKRVLDVGCGRGGTLAVVNQFFRPARGVGVDLSSAAIAFCRTVHRLPNTLFLEGDAEQLPFQDGAFDVVLNVESSHSYPDIGSFYAEVKRILAPGGYFLYADLFAPERFGAHETELRRLGFTLEQGRDITRNVLLSCRETARLRSRAFAEIAQQEVIGDFLSAPGSTVFQKMESGRAVYRILKMTRA